MDQSTARSRRSQRPWLFAMLIASAGAGVLIYFWSQARPLWVDEEMLGLNARDRSFTELAGALWMGQAAPIGWLAVERASMLALGLSERAVRAQPVMWGLMTLATVVWVGRRWLGPVGAAVLALLCAFGSHIWFFALELKQYSADTFGGLLLPVLAACVVDVSAEKSSTLVRRADLWWIVAALFQWLSYGALFVTPGCAVMLVAVIWQRAGREAALRASALSLVWLLSLGLHYHFGIRYASTNAYLREYWAPAFPPYSTGFVPTLQWFAGRFDALANVPGSTRYAASFWIAFAGGLAIGLRERSTLALMLAPVVPSAFLLAAFLLVPLSDRLSLWVLPTLYIGIAIAADKGVRALRVAVDRRRWALATVALVWCLIVGRLCADIYRDGQWNIRTRSTTTHNLDDRRAIRALMTQRRPGDAMLVTHLGLPAVWWYGNVDLSNENEGASLPDGGAIFEVWHEPSSRDCGPDVLRRAVWPATGATVYLGFELRDHIEDLLLSRLAELGVVTTYQRFAEDGRTAVVDFRQPPMGKLLLPGRELGHPLVRPPGCLTVTRASRW